MGRVGGARNSDVHGAGASIVTIYCHTDCCNRDITTSISDAIKKDVTTCEGSIRRIEYRAQIGT